MKTESRQKRRDIPTRPRVTKESLRLQPRYGAASLGSDVVAALGAPESGGGTLARLGSEESRLYTAGRGRFAAAAA